MALERTAVKHTTQTKGKTFLFGIFSKKRNLEPLSDPKADMSLGCLSVPTPLLGHFGENCGTSDNDDVFKMAEGGGIDDVGW